MPHIGDMAPLREGIEPRPTKAGGPWIADKSLTDEGLCRDGCNRRQRRGLRPRAALRLVLVQRWTGSGAGRWSYVRERQRPKNEASGAAKQRIDLAARRSPLAALAVAFSLVVQLFAAATPRLCSRRPPSPSGDAQRSPPNSGPRSATPRRSAPTSTIKALLASTRRSVIAAINVRSAASPLRPRLSYPPAFRRLPDVSKATPHGIRAPPRPERSSRL